MASIFEKLKCFLCFFAQWCFFSWKSVFSAFLHKNVFFIMMGKTIVYSSDQWLLCDHITHVDLVTFSLFRKWHLLLGYLVSPLENSSILNFFGRNQTLESDRFWVSVRYVYSFSSGILQETANKSIQPANQVAGCIAIYNKHTLCENIRVHLGPDLPPSTWLQWQETRIYRHSKRKFSSEIITEIKVF